MQKYPHTRQGMDSRRNSADVGYGKHRPGLQFNPHSGEPHTAGWLADQRKKGLRRVR